MKFKAFPVYIGILISPFLTLKAQCDDKLGYDKQGNLASSALKGYLSTIDTSLKVFFIPSLIKTEMTNGIMFYGFCDRTTGVFDGSVKVKLIFQDQSFITLEKYIKEENSIGFFDALISDKYRLLLLRTKPVIKIQITGSRLDAATYLVNGLIAIDFMLGIDCLQQYL